MISTSRDPAPLCDETTARVIGADALAAALRRRAPHDTRASLTFFPPNDRDAWRRAIEDARAMDAWRCTLDEGARDAFCRALDQLPSLQRVLRRLSADHPIEDADLFAIKRSCYSADQLFERAHEPLGVRGYHPERGRARAQQIMAHIHPEPSPTSRFFLSEALDPELAQIADQRGATRRALRAAQKDAHARLLGRYPGARLSGGVLTLPTGALDRGGQRRGASPRGRRLARHEP